MSTHTMTEAMELQEKRLERLESGEYEPRVVVERRGTADCRILILKTINAAKTT